MNIFVGIVDSTQRITVKIRFRVYFFWLIVHDHKIHEISITQKMSTITVFQISQFRKKLCILSQYKRMG